MRYTIRSICKANISRANIIGINHRDLETFKIDMGLSERLIPLIPNGKVIVAESGIDSHDTIVELSRVWGRCLSNRGEFHATRDS